MLSAIFNARFYLAMTPITMMVNYFSNNKSYCHAWTTYMRTRKYILIDALCLLTIYVLTTYVSKYIFIDALCLLTTISADSLDLFDLNLPFPSLWILIKSTQSFNSSVQLQSKDNFCRRDPVQH